jgi:hypothetical protein
MDSIIFEENGITIVEADEAWYEMFYKDGFEENWVAAFPSYQDAFHYYMQEFFVDLD